MLAHYYMSKAPPTRAQRDGDLIPPPYPGWQRHSLTTRIQGHFSQPQGVPTL